MKGRERKMPTLILIITVAVLVGALLAACDIIKKEQAKSARLEHNLNAAEMENYALRDVLGRKTAIIERLEEIKGVAVSSVTFYAPTGNNTKSGTEPEEGKTVAVDPDVIPLGSEVYIEGIGWRKAEDTGGAIKGTDVDVFVNSEAEAQRGGRVDRFIIWRAPNDN